MTTDSHFTDEMLSRQISLQFCWVCALWSELWWDQGTHWGPGGMSTHATPVTSALDCRQQPAAALPWFIRSLQSPRAVCAVVMAAVVLRCLGVCSVRGAPGASEGAASGGWAGCALRGILCSRWGLHNASQKLSTVRSKISGLHVLQGQ